MLGGGGVPVRLFRVLKDFTERLGTLVAAAQFGDITAAVKDTQFGKISFLSFSMFKC